MSSEQITMNEVSKHSVKLPRFACVPKPSPQSLIPSPYIKKGYNRRVCGE
jgi:hypothetical protein